MSFVRTKRNKIILWILLIVLLIGGGTASFALCRNRVSAAAESISLSEENAKLVLPSSYEQYLSLNSPSSVAISDKYIAIADGKNIYIYDKTDPSKGYQTYQYSGGEHVTIGKLQFSPSGRLYFLSTEGLFKLSLESELASEQVANFPLFTFLIDGETLYTVTKTEGANPTIYAFDQFESEQEQLTLNKASRSAQIDQTGKDSSPLITLADNVLYCVIGDNVIRYDPSSLGQLSNKFYLNTSVNHVPVSVCATDGALFYTTANGLYRSNLNGNSDMIVDGSSFGALTEWDGSLYFLQGKAVRAYDLAEQKITDYEITAASVSQNRLDSATESVRAGDLLVTADKGNNRVSIYDISADTFETIPCEDVTLVATDGKIVTAAAKNQIYTYERGIDGHWSENQEYFIGSTLDSLEYVNGIACVFGKIYYTSSAHRGVLGGGAVFDTTTPKGLAANLYGDIFVAYDGGKVSRFTEETFIQNSTGEDMSFTLPTGFHSLRADFEGNLYYLNQNGELCRNGEEPSLAKIDATKYVYTTADRSPSSFALGFEDDEVYFCFGDFIVRSEKDRAELGISTLESVSREVLEAAQSKLSEVTEDKDCLLADFSEGSVSIHLNLDALLGEGTFSLGYDRYAAERRGVVLDTVGKYTLVALYDAHVYSVELFRTEDMKESSAPQISPAENETWYLSSDCPPYHFPCIIDPPAREDALPRGTKVTVLSYLLEGGQDEELGGYNFAYIEYETAARTRLRGYVPVAYLSAANPLGDANENFTLGYVKPGAVFTDGGGNDVTFDERVLARLYENDDGTYTARFEKDGVSYTATVRDDQIELGESDAVRIALIVILSVLAVLIVGAYVFLLPRDKKNKK